MPGPYRRKLKANQRTLNHEMKQDQEQCPTHTECYKNVNRHRVPTVSSAPLKLAKLCPYTISMKRKSIISGVSGPSDCTHEIILSSNRLGGVLMIGHINAIYLVNEANLH